MTTPKPRLSRMTGADRDELVAYLDGELPVQRERELDRLLVDNAVARQEVKRLADVYEMLDYLPQPEVSADFTETTMATLIASKPAKREDLPTTRLDVGSLFRTALIAFMLTAVAFATARFIRPSKAERTLELLPVLERLDELRAVENREFLDWLSNDSVRLKLEETAR